MMPITQVETTREDLVGVSFRVLRSGNDVLIRFVKAMVPVVLFDLIEATDAEVHLAQTFLLQCFE